VRGKHLKENKDSSDGMLKDYLGRVYEEEGFTFI